MEKDISKQELSEEALEQASGGSGIKINNAADDDSGLAISERMRVVVRPLADT